MAAFKTAPLVTPQANHTTVVKSGAADTSKDLHWLMRYARHAGIKLDTRLPDATAIKRCFTPAAWRLLCRSDRSCFIPILRNRRLNFESLVQYTQALVEHGFQVAPGSHLLEYFIRASYLFYNQVPGVPHSQDEMTLIRLANRQGAVSRQELRLVHEWLDPDRGSVTKHMTWRSVLRHARAWQQRRRLVVELARADEEADGFQIAWSFACGVLPWRGYDIVPLATEIDLWDEGQAMSSCLYTLRGLCKEGSQPSRFFSVRKHGRRYATLELVCELQDEGKQVAHRHGERWRLQDCRLSHNRLPSEDLIHALTEFATHYSHLAQRPSSTTAAAKMIRPKSARKPHPKGTTPLGLVIRDRQFNAEVQP